MFKTILYWEIATVVYDGYKYYVIITRVCGEGGKKKYAWQLIMLCYGIQKEGHVALEN